jgi:hypothetical protein
MLVMIKYRVYNHRIEIVEVIRTSIRLILIDRFNGISEPVEVRMKIAYDSPNSKPRWMRGIHI